MYITNRWPSLKNILCKATISINTMKYVYSFYKFCIYFCCVNFLTGFSLCWPTQPKNMLKIYIDLEPQAKKNMVNSKRSIFSFIACSQAMVLFFSEPTQVSARNGWYNKIIYVTNNIPYTIHIYVCIYLVARQFNSEKEKCI